VPYLRQTIKFTYIISSDSACRVARDKLELHVNLSEQILIPGLKSRARGLVKVESEELAVAEDLSTTISPGNIKIVVEVACWCNRHKKSHKGHKQSIQRSHRLLWNDWCQGWYTSKVLQARRWDCQGDGLVGIYTWGNGSPRKAWEVSYAQLSCGQCVWGLDKCKKFAVEKDSTFHLHRRARASQWIIARVLASAPTDTCAFPLDPASQTVQGSTPDPYLHK